MRTYFLLSTGCSISSPCKNEVALKNAGFSNSIKNLLLNRLNSNSLGSCSSVNNSDQNSQDNCKQENKNKFNFIVNKVLKDNAQIILNKSINHYSSYLLDYNYGKSNEIKVDIKVSSKTKTADKTCAFPFLCIPKSNEKKIDKNGIVMNTSSLEFEESLADKCQFILRDNSQSININ